MSEYLIRQTAYRRQLTDREWPVQSAVNAVALATARGWEEVYGLMLEVAARVIHPAFGPGQVTGVEGEGRSCRITLRFEDGGEKTLGEMWVRTHCAQGA